MFAATAANGAPARSWAEEHAVEECQNLPKAAYLDAANVRGLKRTHQVDAKSGIVMQATHCGQFEINAGLYFAGTAMQTARNTA